MTTQQLHCSRHAFCPALSRLLSRMLTLVGIGTIGILNLAAMPVPALEPDPAATATPAQAAADPVQVVASALTECSNPLPSTQRLSLARVIHQESEEHGYDPLFITALVQVESGCEPKARGGEAIGLTQLLPSTARSVARRAGLPWGGSHTLVDPETNLQIGVRYLRQLEEMLDDPYRAIAAYNMGPAPVLRMSAQRAQRVSYVRKVMLRYQQLRRQHA